MFGAQQRKRFVSADFGDVVHEIGFHFEQQFFCVAIHRWNLKRARQRLRPGTRAVEDGAALHARQFAPSRELIASPESCAEDGKTNGFHTLVANSGFKYAKLCAAHASSFATVHWMSGSGGVQSSSTAVA